MSILRKMGGLARKAKTTEEATSLFRKAHALSELHNAGKTSELESLLGGPIAKKLGTALTHPKWSRRVTAGRSLKKLTSAMTKSRDAKIRALGNAIAKDIGAFGSMDFINKSNNPTSNSGSNSSGSGGKPSKGGGGW